MYLAIGRGDRIISRHRNLTRAALAVALEGCDRVEKEGNGAEPVITDLVYAVAAVLQRWDATAFLRIGNGHWTVQGIDELLDVIARHGRPTDLRLQIGTKTYHVPRTTVDELAAAAKSSIVIRHEDIV